MYNKDYLPLSMIMGLSKKKKIPKETRGGPFFLLHQNLLLGCTHREKEVGNYFSKKTTKAKKTKNHFF